MARKKQGKRSRPRAASTDAGAPGRAIGPDPGADAAPPWRALVAVLVGGLIVKLAVLALRQHAPDFAHPLLDAGFHDWLARGWSLGSWTLPPDAPDPQLDRQPFPRPPLYPALLAVLYKLTGASPWGARVLQALLGVATAAATAAVSARLAPDTRWLPPVAAALVLLCPELVYFEGELVAAAPAGLGVIGVVLLLARWRERPVRARAALLGMALAACVHLRPNLLALLPVIALGVGWRPTDTTRPRRVVALAIIVVIVGASLVPVAVRNQRASGERVLLSTNGGITLLHGNHAHADGQTMSLPRHPALASVQDVSPFSYPRLAQTVSAALGRPMSVAATDTWLRTLATTWIAEHPGAFVTLSLRKLAMFLGPVPVSNNKQVALELDDNAVLTVLPGRWWLLLALALLGALWTLGRRNASTTDGDDHRQVLLVVVVAAVAILVAAVVPFLPAARFRAPLVPLLAVLAALGLSRLLHRLREREQLPLTTAAAAAVLVVCVPNWTGTAPDVPQWRLDRSTAWRYAQRPDEARKELEAALRHAPTHPDVHLNLGYLLATSGDLSGARVHFEQSLRSRPDHLQARAQLGATLYGLGDAKRAAPMLADVVRRVPADVTSRYNYALALEQLGERAQARAQLTEVLRQRPDLAPAQRALTRLQAPASSP